MKVSFELDLVSAAIAEVKGGKNLSSFLKSFLADEVQQTPTVGNRSFSQKVKHTSRGKKPSKKED